MRKCINAFQSVQPGASLLVFIGFSIIVSLCSADTTYLFRSFAGPSFLASDPVDGPVDRSALDLPAGMAKDAAGNLYIVGERNTIRKLSTGGQVSTFAGNANGSGSEDGPGPSARFNIPIGIVVASDGSLFVTDANNNTIRRITADGVVSTFAGAAGESGSSDGQGSSARFNFPTGIAIAPDNTLFVTDSLNALIRKITPSGTVSTVAGAAGVRTSVDGLGSAATFSRPDGIALDAAGNLYVADYSAHVIRKITPAGAVTTVAGSPNVSGSADGVGSAARFNGPRGVAVNAAGEILVADFHNDCIRKISSGGIVTTYAGKATAPGSYNGSVSQALFQAPNYLLLDSQQTLFVSELSKSDVRQINSAGIVSVVAGIPPVSDYVDGTGPTVRFGLINGISVDPTGNLYISDGGNFCIRKISTAGEVTTYSGSRLQGFADGPSGTARFDGIEGLCVEPGGRLYVADRGNQVIRAVAKDGSVSTLAGKQNVSGSTDGSGANATFGAPADIAVDSAGSAYIADRQNHLIRKISPAGQVTTLAGRAGVAGNADGAALAASFSSPDGVAVDSGGIVYVADDGNSEVRKISPSGVVTTLARFRPATFVPQLYSSSKLAVDPAGNIFVADATLQQVMRITSSGVATKIADSTDLTAAVGLGPEYGYYLAPQAVAIGSNGDVYIGTKYIVYKASISTAVPPIITTPPVAQSTVVGGTATFTVLATNAASYQWRKNGIAIIGATSPTLTISNAQLSDGGDYDVLISGPGGSTQSAPAYLTVGQPSGARFVNISTRAYVGTGGDVMIAGFIIGGTGQKTLLIRASGPALTQFNVSGVLPDPFIELHDATHTLTTNDNWSDDSGTRSGVLQAVQVTGAFAWPEGSKDAALVATLAPGGYTVVLSGKGGTTGVSLIEIFDVSGSGSCKLINISTRSIVRTGDDVQIAGFVISGDSTKNIIVRASGPALTKYGVNGVLDDPVIDLHGSSSTLASNDNWDQSLQNVFAKAGIDNWAVGSNDSALVSTLLPGGYTLVVSGKAGHTGVALVELYEKPD